LYRAGTERGLVYMYVYGKCVKDRNVNSKCTHRQITRLWLKRTDQVSRQRGGPTETGQHISDRNTWKEAISSQTSTKWARHQDVLTEWLSAVKWVWFTKNRLGLSSERAPHRDRTTNSRPKLLKRMQYLVKRPQSWLDIKTYWLTVSRKMTLTLLLF
jgi:hypothetical protein